MENLCHVKPAQKSGLTLTFVYNMLTVIIPSSTKVENLWAIWDSLWLVIVEALLSRRLIGGASIPSGRGPALFFSRSSTLQLIDGEI